MYLLTNALNLETATVVSELGGNNAWSLKGEYLFSQLTYEHDYLFEYNKNAFKPEEDYKRHLDELRRNDEANKSLEKFLKVTEEEKQVLRKK